MLSKILIIDKRKELPAKYKKNIEDADTSVTISNNLKDALYDIQELEPDMIIVSDSIDEPLDKFCEKIRSLTYNIRPVIIALSKSADSGDRILVLDSGADDFLSEPVNIEEFKTRIHAHLRRDIELNLDTKTLLPNRKIVEKMLKRILHTQNSQAVLLVGVENLENYKSVYSDIAADKLIQTFVAITKSSLEPDDFLGQLNETNFIIITNPYRAEKLAAFLTFAFDTVAPKFYSEQDARRGYMLMKSDRQAGMRANFVSVMVGGMLGNYEHLNTVEALIERLYSIKKIAKVPSGSNYVIDRMKLTGENIKNQDSILNHIFIKEPDDALALLLRTTLELQGYDVEDSINTENSIQPAILIVDSGDNLEELEFCRKLKSNPNFANSKIIVTTSVHDKAAVLDAGVDLYLPKPYEITDLIQWIEYFMKNII
jgi:DNA-binding response OmpR family regulator